MLNKQYFLVYNKLVPVIGGGSADSVGSTISVQFGDSISFSPDTSRSTDIHFVQLALGEGPIYRINPNGPQDIEIDGKFIDDLVDFNSNNTKPGVFKTAYRLGTETQSPMSDFFTDIINPVRFTSPVTLKSGISESDTPAPPETSVQFFPTSDSNSATPITSIVFKYDVKNLSAQDALGTFGTDLSLINIVHDSIESSNVQNYIAAGGVIVNSLVDDSMKIDVEIRIPEDKRSANGYSISATKISPDIAEEGYASEVTITGFDEVRKQPYSYPRTALAGYAVKSSDFRTGTIPNYSSLVKGLIVDVPSNYNQPILESGEVDWRQIEVPGSGAFSSGVNGYRLQNTGKTLLTSSNVTVYQGVWDGTYKKDWTENAAWIIKYLLTNKDNGLGLPESSIDKFSFYKAAQYYDAVDPATGNFTGVKGFSDGSFRYKPNGFLTDIENNLLGLDEGVEVLERRFVTGLTITDKTQALELINSIAASCRSLVTTFGNKVAIIVDQEEQLPVAYFNETNIEEGSFKISGVSSAEEITGVDVSFMDFVTHFEKTSLSLDVDTRFNIVKENRLSIDASACTRRSQALRLASYHLESRINNKRKVQFSAFSDASDLEVGDIVAVSQKAVGTNYGFGGKVLVNSNENYSNVYLEHITSPTINTSFFTSNTNPIVLKIFRQESNELDYYLISGDFYSLQESGNTVSGTDLVEVSIAQKLNKITKTFESNSAFSTSSAPKRNDLWALGEIDLTNIYDKNSDKLFRIDTINFEENGIVRVAATEYNSNVLALSDNAAVSSNKTQSKTSLRYKTPPIPNLSLRSIPSKTAEGVVFYNARFNSSVDSSNYNVPITTQLSYGLVTNGVIDIFEQE